MAPVGGIRRRPGPARQFRPCLRTTRRRRREASEDLPHPLGPTTSAASPSRSSRVRSRHSSRREMGVRTETRSRRSVAPSRGTPRRMKREGMVLVPVASRRDFLGRDFLSRSSPALRARVRVRSIFDGVKHRQESFQALRLRGEPRELLEAPDDDVERPLHGSKRVPGLRDHPELDLAGEEPGRDDETGKRTWRTRTRW